MDELHKVATLLIKKPVTLVDAVRLFLCLLILLNLNFADQMALLAAAEDNGMKERDDQQW